MTSVLKKIHYICAIVSFFESLYAFQFTGIHFMASYHECNYEALCNEEKLKMAMQKAISQCGATILNSSEYTFSPEGCTVVWVLSESHASIHTYPEHNACFVDLFTCGNQCSYEIFDQQMRAYLEPKIVSVQSFRRQ